MQTEYNILTDIQAEVLGYLEENPTATDTVEGIRQWWLMQRMAKYSAERVQTALKQLKDSSLIGTQQLDNGSEVFYKILPL